MKSAQAGNVLFLILIAVALFAALSYAVTSSMRSGNSDISQEKAAAGAAQMIEHLAHIRATLDRMKLINGCTDEQFNFSTSAYTMANPNSPPDKKCHLFDIAGGGMNVEKFPPQLFDDSKFGSAVRWHTNLGTGNDYLVGFNSNNRWLNIGTHDQASASVDLIGQIYGISDVVCKEINKKLGVNGPTYSPPSLDLYVLWQFMELTQTAFSSIFPIRRVVFITTPITTLTFWFIR